MTSRSEVEGFDGHAVGASMVLVFQSTGMTTQQHSPVGWYRRKDKAIEVYIAMMYWAPR